jgi:hypothetical protein
MEYAPQQIVGVVEDMRQARLDLEPAPQMFVDYRQVLALTQARKLPTAAQERLAFGFLSFVVRTAGEPAELMPVVRSLVARVDPSAGIDATLPMDQLVAASLTRQRFYALAVPWIAAGSSLRPKTTGLLSAPVVKSLRQSRSRGSSSRSSIGAPSSRMNATRTPGDGEFGGIRISLPSSAASRSSTANARCGTVFTISGTGHCGSKRIHSMPYGLVSNPQT